MEEEGDDFSFLLAPVRWDKAGLARASPMRNPTIRQGVKHIRGALHRARCVDQFVCLNFKKINFLSC